MWTAGSTSALTDGRRKLFVAGGQRTNGTRPLLSEQLRPAQTPREPDFSRESTWQRSFLAGLGGGLGGLARCLRFIDGLDDTDGDGLSHVSDGESSKWWVLREGLDAHRLGGGHEDDGGITRLDLLGEVFHLLTRSSIDLLLEFGELAGDMGSVAIEDWGVAVSDLTRVVHDDDLSGEGLGLLGGVVLGVGGDVSSSDVLDGNVLDVESDVVTGAGLWEGLVVHLDGLNFSGDESQQAFTVALAAHFKKTGKMKVPEWVDLVKTNVGKELAPYDEDWYFVRCASIARHIYVRSPVGVSTIRKIY